MMTEGEGKQLMALLRDWYRWQSGYKPDLGAGRVSASCRAFSEESRFASEEEKREAAERKAWHERSQQVEACVGALHWQQRAAIQTQMLNAEARASVWRNARITPEQNAIYFVEAKMRLFPMFVTRGLMQREEQLQEIA